MLPPLRFRSDDCNLAALTAQHDLIPLVPRFAGDGTSISIGRLQAGQKSSNGLTYGERSGRDLVGRTERLVLGGGLGFLGLHHPEPTGPDEFFVFACKRQYFCSDFRISALLSES